MPNPGVPNKIIIFKKYIYIGLYIYCKPVADPGFLEGGGGRRQFGWRGGGGRSDGTAVCGWNF